MWYFGSHGDHGPMPGVRKGAAWLAAYDPESFALLDRFYRGWMPVTEEVWAQASPIDAAKGRELRSAPSREQARLLIRNLSGVELRLYWLDFAGARKPYGAIPPFGTALQDTFVQHAWLVMTAEGSTRALAFAEQPASMLLVR
jgi:hypothetical protein